MWLCFSSVCLFVCLSVCLSVRRITHKLVNGFDNIFWWHDSRTKWYNFGDDPDRTSHQESNSEIRIFRISGGLFSVNTFIVIDVFSYGISDEKCSSQLEGYPVCHGLETLRSWPMKDWVTFLRWRGPHITNTKYQDVKKRKGMMQTNVFHYTSNQFSYKWRDFLLVSPVGQAPLSAVNSTVAAPFVRSRREVGVIES